MKIRNGFVSNSSSSSFVVAFDKIPETCEELRNIMFPDKEQIIVDFYDHCSVDEVVQQVLADIKAQEPTSEDEIKDEISSGHYTGHPDYNQTDGPIDAYRDKFYKKFGYGTKWSKHPDWEKREREISQECRKEYDEVCRKAELKYYEEIKEQFEGKICLTFHYGDNDGSFFAIMEHGDIFCRLPHIRISHH